MVLAAQQRQNPERKRQDYMGGDEQHQVALQAQPFKDLNKQKPALTAWLWGRCSRGRWERSKREEGGRAKSRGKDAGGCSQVESGRSALKPIGTLFRWGGGKDRRNRKM